MRKQTRRIHSQERKLHAWDMSPGLLQPTISASTWNGFWVYCEQKVLLPCAIQKPVFVSLKPIKRHAWRHYSKSTQSISPSSCKHMTRKKAYRPSWRNANQPGRICKPRKHYGKKSPLENTFIPTSNRHPLPENTLRTGSRTQRTNHPRLLHHRKSRLGRCRPAHRRWTLPE